VTFLINFSFLSAAFQHLIELHLSPYDISILAKTQLLSLFVPASQKINKDNVLFLPPIHLNTESAYYGVRIKAVSANKLAQTI
jgi:hypothetical protein